MARILKYPNQSAFAFLRALARLKFPIRILQETAEIAENPFVFFVCFVERIPHPCNP